MSLSPDQISQIERRLVDLAAELMLARSASDERLVPVYSRVAELEDLLVAAPPLLAPVRTVKAALGGLLDQSGTLAPEALAELNRFLAWMRTALAAVKRHDALPAMAPLRLGSASLPAAPVPALLPADERLVLDLAHSRELLVEFHAETLDHLEAVEAALLLLERNGDDLAVVDQIFRCYHSIKGNAGFLHLRPMQLLAHEVESLLDLVRQRRLRVTVALIDLMLQSRDAMLTLTQQIGLALHDGTAPEAVVPLRALLQLLRALPVIDDESQTGTPWLVGTERAPSVAARGAAATVRVSVGGLRRLREAVAELRLVRAQLVEARADEVVLQPLTRVIDQVDDQTRAFLFVPLRALFRKMERLVRDLAPRLGKEVQLQCMGEATEVDRMVAEGLADPLMHMMRNALDHGIEPPPERIAAGKAATGVVTLRAACRAGQIELEIQDDGRGMDPARIRHAAVARGIVAEDVVLSREETLALIFAPGFSLAEKVTAVSGRGVGMDVLKQNIDRLGGRIEITSKVGVGSTFRIMLPGMVATSDL